MSNDKGLERQDHNPDRCCHRHHGFGTRTLQAWLLIGVFTLWGLWVVLIPPSLSICKRPSAAVSVSRGTPAPCRGYRAEHLTVPEFEGPVPDDPSPPLCQPPDFDLSASLSQRLLWWCEKRPADLIRATAQGVSAFTTWRRSTMRYHRARM